MPLERYKVEDNESILTRNGVTVELYLGEFGKNSKENAGKKFPFPILSESNWDRDVAMIGKPFICNRITRILRSIFGGLYVSAWDKDTGEVNWDDWSEAAEAFTEGEEKREQLQDRKNDLSDKFALITESDDFMQHPEKYSEQLKAIGDEVQGINDDLKKIQAEIEATTAKRNATKAEKAKKLAEANAASMAKKQAEHAGHAH